MTVQNSSKPTIEKPSFALSPLTAAISFAIAASATPLASQAQQASDGVLTKSEPHQLSKLIAKDAEEERIKVDAVASPKFTQPLLDTPQTITVVTQEVLQQQRAGTLIEALRNTPGITLQLGENGNTSAGDTFSMRGSSTQSSIFIDGIRDTGAITRDTFNTAQVEISKGATGADNGRGGLSGYINQVTKVPLDDDFGSADLSASTATSVRGTGDINHTFGNTAALRLNAMWQNGDVAGRDFVEGNRWGVAPSLAFGLGTTTRYYLYSQHVREDNVPDGGIPSIGYQGYYNSDLPNNGVTAAKIDRNNFYGRYDDDENTRSDVITFRVEQDFSGGARLVNTSRYSKSGMDRVLTSINSVDDNDVSNLTPPSDWIIPLSRQGTNIDNKILTNQTNFTFGFNTGSVKHDMTSGLEFIKEQQYTALFTSGTDNNLLYSPDAYAAYTYPVRNGQYRDGKTTTYAGYVFDTLHLGEQWLVTAGGRYEHYNTDYAAFESPGGGAAPIAVTQKDARNLFSWKTAITFKPAPNGSIYAAYSNTLSPPGGDDFRLRTNDTGANNISNPRFDPQEASHIEIGTKWDLFAQRLALTLAVYRTDNLNSLVELDDSSGDYVQLGKTRYEGVEFGVIGNLTENWQILGGVAWTDAKIIDGTTGNSGSGAELRWNPPLSATLWTTYCLNKLTLGGGASYFDESKRVINPATDISTESLPVIPSYTVLNAMASYAVNDSMSVQLNVDNLLNEEYIQQLNNSGRRVVLGMPRTAQLTASFKF
ncbi:MAG: TonB-dependent siderophore receptor [Steroidobacteraceae bacterium]